MNAPLKTETIEPALRALKLAEQGFYIFPSWRKDRHIAGWPTRATRDASTIREWFTGPYKDCWPSIFTGKFGDGLQSLIVVDVDPRGVAAMKSGALDAVLPDTRVHRTPRGGFHGFYIAPFPGVKSGTNILADGIDIRSKGGLVHFGEGYAIEQDEPIAQAPAALIAKCGDLAPATSPADRAQDRIAPDQETALQRAEEIMRTWPKVAEGERNNALRDFIYRVREHCATDAGSTLAIGLAFAEACNPPYPEDEARATIRSAIKSAQNPAGSKTALPEDFPVMQPVAVLEAPAPKVRTKGGTLQDVARRIDGGAYLVKGLLRRKSHAVMYGAPGEGKSFLALDLAYHVAAGQPWHARRVSQGPALYLAFEGLGGMPERAAALLQHYGNDAVPLVIESADWNLRDKAGREALGARMAEIRAEHFGGQHPALIVIDTLARSMRGGDENSAQDMGALNDAVGALIEHTGACALLVHHSGKNRAAGARGSSALLGAVDTELEVDGGQLRATKQRDVELGAPLGFKLAPVVVGEDADGEPMLSCVVLASAGGAQASWKPTGRAADAWRALCELGGESNAAVSLSDLAPAFRAKAYPVGVKESAARMALNRALAAFLERGLVEGSEGGPWRRALR